MSARARRAIARRLYDEMSGMIFATSHTDTTLYAALAEARAIHGGKARVLEDVKREPLSYDRLLVGTPPAGQASGAKRRGRDCRPAAAQYQWRGGLLCLQAIGRVPAMLNLPWGWPICARPAPRRASPRSSPARLCRTGQAGRYRGRAGGGGSRSSIWKIWPPASAAWKSCGRWPPWADRRAPCEAGDQPRCARGGAVHLRIGGVPKGVVLSHRNLLANLAQLSARIDFNASDVVLNALPVFHSFGLTGHCCRCSTAFAP
jgi:acyl-[acyl-carrier-protein]-phospholipid O-acyltransferase/long-chain-fatty-acid--[acyl-carrier-protein] ligase